MVIYVPVHAQHGIRSTKSTASAIDDMTTYQTIHTNYGLQRMAQAESSGVAINLVAVSVGDGGGNPTTPNAAQTQLVRELFRTAPNRVYQDPTNPLMFTVEMVIPATVGGFTIREMAAWDDQGGMFTVANTPDAYKPQGDGSEGSFSDTTIRMQFVASNASVVTLQVDPNVAVATQAWISNTITLPYLLKGGSTGQMLVKNSNSDGDVKWIDPTEAAVTVSVTDETQTLAAAQTAVVLATCTTFGLAVYVEGVRLLPTEWTANPTDHTKLTLATSYPAGSKIYFVQNDPAAFYPAPLVQSLNLSDVPNQATARTNLGVDSMTNTNTHAPASKIGYFASSSAPAGWLKANGAAISRTAYAALFAAIGTIYGVGDGFNTFNLPDLRGEFMRGFDDGRGVDSGRAFGSSQVATSIIQSIGGQAGAGATESLFMGGGGFDSQTTNSTWGSVGILNGYWVNASGSSNQFTVRPRNVAMLACIKY